jgi:hypothetical protein
MDTMTPEQEFAIRSKLKWQRDGNDWVLLYGRRRMGRVVRDAKHPGMFQSVKSRGVSDHANLSWSKDVVVGAAIREIAWDVATDPSKCPVNRGAAAPKSSHVGFNAGPGHRAIGKLLDDVGGREGDGGLEDAWNLVCEWWEVEPVGNHDSGIDPYPD